MSSGCPGALPVAALPRLGISTMSCRGVRGSSPLCFSSAVVSRMTSSAIFSCSIRSRIFVDSRRGGTGAGVLVGAQYFSPGREQHNREQEQEAGAGGTSLGNPVRERECQCSAARRLKRPVSYSSVSSSRRFSSTRPKKTPASNSSHMGRASSDWEITSGA
jgi:hypothetical protein